MSKREQEVVVNLFLSVYAPALILSVCRGLLLPVLPLFARSFEVSYSLVGVVLAADGSALCWAMCPREWWCGG